MTQRKGISTGTTAQRSIEEAGKIRFNTTTSLLEYYDGTDWKSIDAPPTVSSVSPSNLLSGDGTGNYTIVVTGSGFSSSVTATIITDGGTEITPDTTTRDSATQVTLVVAKNTANLTNANEPFDIKITNNSGLAGTLADALNVDAQPVFSTSAGSLFSGTSSSYSDITISASDPESGGDITYSLESGSLPAGLSGTSTSSGYVISGTPTNPVSNTTSNFTIRAADVNSNISDRAFSITINAIQFQSFTSSGTFSVPSGTTSVDVLVVAGGGSGGGQVGGGGGAGGLIYRPGFPVTPGGTVTVTVGDGGTVPGSSQTGVAGQDSVFGTLTAKGGGRGGSYEGGGSGTGGSGGGGGNDGGLAGSSATQPTQPGDSGTYGFGNSGGNGYPGQWGGGGGGGAGAAGNNAAASQGGNGGNGKAYTIADGTTSVYYAGGGGGCSDDAITPSNGSGGQGGGGNGGTNSGGGAPGTAGTANRGGGGGGTRDYPNPYSGHPGGKGIVIVQY